MAEIPQKVGTIVNEDGRRFAIIRSVDGPTYCEVAWVLSPKPGEAIDPDKFVISLAGGTLQPSHFVKDVQPTDIVLNIDQIINGLRRGHKEMLGIEMTPETEERFRKELTESPR